MLGVYSNTAGSAALLSDQLFTPYGTQLLANGNALSQYTAKGFTGQYNDAVSGLDYYVSRYYDPVAGVFLSADAVQGNVVSMNPYGYVGNNPETDTDPTGQYFAPPGGNGNGNPPPSCTFENDCQSGSSGGPSYPCGVACLPFPYGNLVPTKITLTPITITYATNYVTPSWQDFQPKNTTSCGTPAGSQPLCMNFHGNYALHVSVSFGGAVGMAGFFGQGVISVPGEFNPFNSFPGGGGGDNYGEEAGSNLADYLSSDETGTENSAFSDTGGPCSFTPTTQVETNHGEQTIGTLKVGEQVLAYNPKTRKMEDEPILHVWINHDHDLVDLTITTKIYVPHGKVVTITNETIHTNKKHPFFTLEKGFVPVGQLTLGMHILRADGRYGVVTGYKVVPGTKMMYNLEIAKDHTFTVGNGQWVVHNSAGTECGGEQINANPDAITAFENVQKNLGGPLGNTATPTAAKFGDPAEMGLNNGMQEGERGWRLEWDPDKGGHFNWYDWSAGKKSSGFGRWGAETFPASQDQVTEMVLYFHYEGIETMLANAP